MGRISKKAKERMAQARKDVIDNPKRTRKKKVNVEKEENVKLEVGKWILDEWGNQGFIYKLGDKYWITKAIDRHNINFFMTEEDFERYKTFNHNRGNFEVIEESVPEEIEQPKKEKKIKKTKKKRKTKSTKRKDTK